MIRIIIFTSFILWSSLGLAQNNKEYSFTIEEAITFALDSSYTAINSRRDVAKAIKKKWETTATGLPQISAELNYQNNLKQPVTLLPGEIAGGLPGTFVPITFGTKQNGSATATLNQLIFDGSYLVGLQAAKVFLNYSKNADEKTKLEIRKGVINAYGSVLLAEELISIFEKNKITLEKNLNETRAIYENGLTEEENVEQLEITLIDIKNQLNNSKRSKIIARQMFNLAIGIDVNNKVTFKEKLEDLANQNISLNTLDSTFNMDNNIDFRIANNFTKQRSLELKLEKSKALPTLSAFVNYGTSANSDSFTFFDSEQIWYQSSLLGLKMNIPIFSSGMRGAKTQQARISLDQAKTDLINTKQNILLELNTAKSNYRFSIDNYDNAKKNLALAERIENKNQIKFKEGLTTSFDLRQAQIQLYSAQQQYFQSMLEVINSKSSLDTVLNNSNLN